MKKKIMAHNLQTKERTGDIKLNENVNFSEMFFTDQVFNGLKNAGFKYPSPIQLAAIPLGKCGLDVIIQAKSGTGKTLVFSIVALEMINTTNTSPQVLIMAPTREIAFQIGTVLKMVGSKMPNLKVHTFIGGTSLEKDKSNLKMCHIAIGTPGRVMQLIEIKFLRTNFLKLFVLDEADQLLNSQFMDCIVKIYKLLPSNKQVLALSATYSDEELEFLKKLTISPSFVMLDKESPSLIGVKQFVYCAPFSYQIHHRHQKKVEVLYKILSFLKFNQCIIFSNSQFRAETLCNKLSEKNWSVSYMSGAQEQSERLKSFQALCSHKCRIMVSTDLSARGLDSEHVNLVINLDVPSNQATYLHRIGRAGRYGSLGYAITFACEGKELDSFRNLVTKANLNLKILPKNFTNFENLQIQSSDDYNSLESFSKKMIENKNQYISDSVAIKYKCKDKFDANGKQPTEIMTVKKVNGNIQPILNGTSEVYSMNGAKATKARVVNTIPKIAIINKKNYQPISISYDEIFKQNCQVDRSASTDEERISYYNSILDKKEDYKDWKKVVDDYECDDVSCNSKGTSCKTDSMNDCIKTPDVKANTQCISNYDFGNFVNGNVQNGHIDNGYCKGGETINKAALIESAVSFNKLLHNNMESTGIKHDHVNVTHNSVNVLKYAKIDNTAIKAATLENIVPNVDSMQTADQTGFGAWVATSQNDSTSSFKEETFQFQANPIYRSRTLDEEDSNAYPTSNICFKQKVSHVDMNSCNIDFTPLENSLISAHRSSTKLMKMMNYTRSLGKMSALLSRNYNL